MIPSIFHARGGKAQSAVEFMMIIGIAFTLLIPAMFIFQQFSTQSNEDIITAQINSFGREIISAAESMYYYGESSKSSIGFSFPERIRDMRINPREGDAELSELVIVADVYGGEASFAFFTRVPLLPEQADNENMSDLTAGIQPREDAFMSGGKEFIVESVMVEDSLGISINRVREDFG